MDKLTQVEDVGKHIKRYRRMACLTQKELAYKIGISGAALSKIESGENLPSLTVFVDIKEALHVSFEDLLPIYEPINQSIRYRYTSK